MLYRTLGVGCLSALLLVGGCSNRASQDGMADGAAGASELTDREARIRALEQELANRESRISLLESQLNTSSTEADDSAAMASASEELFPPNAEAGQCFARVLTPEKYSTSEERVLVKEASERFEVIPAVYETVTEKVLVKEATTALEVVPAVYDTVTEEVVVKPASTRIVQVPATFRTVTEQVLDKPASTVWKKGPASKFGNGAVSETTTATGEVMCLVEEPAIYKTVERQVIDTPASTREEVDPAVTKMVERRVVSTPATTREISVPAVYDEVSVTRLVEPAQQRSIEIPAEYRTVTKRQMTASAKLAWQPVLCEVNATSENVRALQSALDDKGYNVGGVDGLLGPSTLRAVNSYAKSLDLPRGDNFVPMAVLEQLGLDI